MQFLLILLFIISCNSQKILNVGQKSETINVELTNIYENDKNYIFLTKKNDIIESSKLGTYNLKCNKIIIGQKYKFEVIPISGMIQGNNHFDRSYDVNDTLRLNYREYYFTRTIKKYCYKK
ncbi:hypothetical protein [Chryseobacterium sp. ISL-6]|uniref:hypothetical protein n=1 Tax=Chryseobacterium sp. ISL-6 TaxID=2819143 RepID=UPI001BE93891|nr:hypothetical protein [Chryseobacterium sp. ISL-6]MBT2620287.1 hypothetical protein [Chryseobacterium sp. ISL-6]